jgi:ankyrin repeat protein
MYNEISKYVNLGDWQKINKMVKKNINVLTEYNINGNNLIHLSCINNQPDIIKYINKSNPKLLELSNINGNTCGHLLANFGYDGLLKECLNKNNNIINMQNTKGETIIHNILDNSTLLNWILKNIKNVDVNIISKDGFTPLLYYIKKSKNTSDVFFENIKLLLDYNVNLNIPEYNPPLCYAASLNKLFIIELLLKYDINVDCVNNNNITPLIISIKNNNYEIVKILLNNGANINYTLSEENINILSMAINNNNNEMIKLLFKHDINVNKHNKYLNTSLHDVLNLKNVNNDILFKLLYYGDLNKQNMDGDTPLHLLLKNHNWKNNNLILKNKKLDIFKENNNGEIPLLYIKNNEMIRFVDILSESYINNLDKTSLNNSLKNKKHNKYKKNVLNKIINNKISSQIHEKDKIDNFNLITGSYANYGKFNANYINNMIYTIEILNKHKNLFVPFQYYNIQNYIEDDKLYYTLNLYKNNDNIIYDIITNYNKLFYSILPYLIIWKNKNIYFIHPKLKEYVLTVINATNIRFILFKLVLISPSGLHSNILIYDKHTNILERFEPYGDIPHLNSDKLNEMLQNKFKDIIKSDIIFITPNNNLKNISFQTISNENDDTVRKLGDPGGYCLAWTFWYIEMKITNPNITSNQLIEKALHEIIHVKKYTNLIDFIRNYSVNLDKIKNNFLLKLGIPKKNLYDVIINDKHKKKLHIAFINNFNTLINDRIK